MPTPSHCPCGTARPYEMCCAMYHNNPGTAPTAETLMRSRYSAFTLNKFDYIQDTQKLDSGQEQSAGDIADSNDHTQWIKLDVIETQEGGEKDQTGMVSFCAHFKEGKHIGRLSERSLFKRIDGTWYYTSGEHEVQGNTPLIKTADMNIGRNDPCHCGSTKKFKKCCG